MNCTEMMLSPLSILCAVAVLDLAFHDDSLIILTLQNLYLFDIISYISDWLIAYTTHSIYPR